MEAETRVRVLADIEEITQLKARYAASCDNNYDADTIAGLFTEDAVWDGGNFGKAEGRENIRAFFRHAPKIFPFAIHHVMNPTIVVDGDSATGEWHLLQPASRSAIGDAGKGRPEAVWLSASYRDEYVRINGRWMFKHLKVRSNFLTSYEEGWAKRRFI